MVGVEQWTGDDWRNVITVVLGMLAPLWLVLGYWLSRWGEDHRRREQRQDDDLRWQREHDVRYNEQRLEIYAAFLGTIHDYVAGGGDEMEGDRGRTLLLNYARVQLVATLPVAKLAHRLHSLAAEAKPAVQDPAELREITRTERQFFQAVQRELGLTITDSNAP